MSRLISWILFGDLHIAGEGEQNYRDFLRLIEEANRHMAATIDFAVLPGDMNWLRHELPLAYAARERVVVFMHAYPSEHGADAAEIRQLFRDGGVMLVEMGHTHDNELANDGRIIYATTRSTGQIEEGPAEFSVTTLDEGVVSWKFKPAGDWPLVMITSQADERLIHDPASPTQMVRGPVQVRARIWGPSIQEVRLSVDKGQPRLVRKLDGCTWGAGCDAEQLDNGLHALAVSATDADGRRASDRVVICLSRAGEYRPLDPQGTDYENAIGVWEEKHILGTQLGPNESGRPWPARRERAGAGS